MNDAGYEALDTTDASEWMWPVPGQTTISSEFGPRSGGQHNGLDIAAPKGSAVVASRSGRVIAAAEDCDHNYPKEVGTDQDGGGYGNYIYIDHGDGFVTRYAHLTDVLVSVGSQVSSGDKIGTVGSTGDSTGYHLHFEVLKNDTKVNPGAYVTPGGSVTPVNVLDVSNRTNRSYFDSVVIGEPQGIYPDDIMSKMATYTSYKPYYGRLDSLNPGVYLGQRASSGITAEEWRQSSKWKMPYIYQLWSTNLGYFDKDTWQSTIPFNYMNMTEACPMYTLCFLYSAMTGRVMNIAEMMAASIAYSDRLDPNSARPLNAFLPMAQDAGFAVRGISWISGTISKDWTNDNAKVSDNAKVLYPELQVSSGASSLQALIDYVLDNDGIVGYYGYNGGVFSSGGHHYYSIIERLSSGRYKTHSGLGSATNKDALDYSFEDLAGEGGKFITRSYAYPNIIFAYNPNISSSAYRSKSTYVGNGYDDSSYNSSYDSYDSDSEVPTYAGGVNGTTVGQRVSGLTDQPIFAYINIWLGDNLLATNPNRPNLIQTLEVSYLEDSGTEASFSIFDDNWEDVEYLLSKNYDNVYLEYGYYGTGVRSDMMKFRLSTYSLEFTSTGTIIHVQAISESASDNLSPTSSELSSYNPTEAVKKICEDLGYVVLDENFDESQDIQSDNPFNLVGEFPISYIMRVITPQASTEDEAVFHFYVEYDETLDKEVAYFKRKSLRTTNTDDLRTYVYQKGYDSNVIDFSVDIHGTFGGNGVGDYLTLASSYESTTISTTDKSETSSSADAAGAMTAEATGNTAFTLTSTHSLVADAAGYTESQMNNILSYRVKANIYDGYTAKLTIVGDPTIKLWGSDNNPYVRVINVTDRGNLHHTSGVYQINKIIHTIDGGSMTTALDLVRANTKGDIDGITLLNPKYIAK